MLFCFIYFVMEEIDISFLDVLLVGIVIRLLLLFVILLVLLFFVMKFFWEF